MRIFIPILLHFGGIFATIVATVATIELKAPWRHGMSSNIATVATIELMAPWRHGMSSFELILTHLSSNELD